MSVGLVPVETRFKGKFSVESIKAEAIKLVESLKENGVFFNFVDKKVICEDRFRKSSQFNYVIDFSSDIWLFETDDAKVSYNSIDCNFNYQEKKTTEYGISFLSSNSVPTIIFNMKSYLYFINYYNNLNSYIPKDTNNYLEKIKDWESFFSNDFNSFFKPKEQFMVFEFYRELHEKSFEDIIKTALRNLKVEDGSISCSISEHFSIKKHLHNNKYFLDTNGLPENIYNSFIFSDLNYNNQSTLKFKIADVLCSEPAVHLLPINKICSNISKTIPVLEQFFSLFLKLELKNKNSLQINKETLDLYILNSDDNSYQNLYQYLPEDSNNAKITKNKKGIKNV